ncbi:MAG: glycosyltransferase family 39 protein [Gaiellaceae bacterium]
MRARREVVIELVLLGTVLVVAGVLFAQGLAIPADYDEGSYLAAVGALRHGQELGSEIFTPQPPGFYYLLAAGDVVTGGSLDAMRAEILALALAGCVAAFLVGRLVAGPIAGLTAAALLAVAHPYPAFASRISADLPALVLALFALAAFLAATTVRRGVPALSVAAGALAVAAVSVKLSAATVAIPLVAYALVLRTRREAALAVAGAGIAVTAFVLGHVGQLDGLWRGAVSYHDAARDVPGPGLLDNAEHFLHLIDPRTRNALFWLAPLGLVAAAISARRGLRLRLPLWPLWLWAAGGEAFLLLHRPLHDNHDVLLAVSLALPVGIAVGAAVERLPRGRIFAAGAAVVAAVLAGGYAEEVRDRRGLHAREPAGVTWAVELLRERTRPGDLVAADRPIIAVYAGRTVPGNLVDTAYLRFRSGYLSPAEVLADLDRERVRAVVTARAFRDQPAILAGLRSRFATRLRRGDVTVYLRPAAAR